MGETPGAFQWDKQVFILTSSRPRPPSSTLATPPWYFLVADFVRACTSSRLNTAWSPRTVRTVFSILSRPSILLHTASANRVIHSVLGSLSLCHPGSVVTVFSANQLQPVPLPSFVSPSSFISHANALASPSLTCLSPVCLVCLVQSHFFIAFLHSFLHWVIVQYQ